MSDNELLLAISDIVSKNVKVLECRIDSVEDKMDKRFDAVDRRIDELDNRLTNQIKALDNRLTLQIEAVDKRVDNVLLRLENIIEPRLNDIESCYTSTYDRYKDGAEKIETLEMNMQVVQSVVKEHGEKLNALTA